jgi:hypothetical protein
MTRSFANGNGDSQPGPFIPLWLRLLPEYAEARAAQASIWTVMA